MNELNRDGLSEADEDALRRLPKGTWFGLRSVSYMVKRPRWRCDRLVEKGLLESRIVGTWPSLETQWRQIENKADELTPSKS